MDLFTSASYLILFVIFYISYWSFWITLVGSILSRLLLFSTWSILFLFLSISLAVLEGIAITFNPDYKVLGSTYPWIARKVLTDSSPQLKSSLQTLLYKVKLNPFSFPLLSLINSIIVLITLKLFMPLYVHLISQRRETLYILCQL